MSIVAVAIRYADGVLSLPPPYRHLDVAAIRKGVTFEGDVRGFLTDTGEFLDVSERYDAEERFEAMFQANPAPAVIIRVGDQRFLRVNQGSPTLN